MTDQPKRTRNTKSELGAGEAADRIFALRDNRDARRVEYMNDFDRDELAKECEIVNRVGEAHRERFEKLVPDAPRRVANDSPSEPPGSELPAGAQPLSKERQERLERLAK